MQKKIVHLVLFKKRPVAGFLVFCIIFMQTFLLNADTKYRVNVMNDMFTQVGWLEWHKEDVFIIYHSLKKTIIGARQLLDPSTNGQIVTDKNVEHKILQAHQFLNCKFANLLKELCEFQRGIGPECMRMNDPSKSLDCLEDSLELLKTMDLIIMRMQGSLACFYQLSPLTAFDTKVFKILEKLKKYCKNVAFDKTSITEGGNQTIIPTLVNETASVERKMSKILTRLTAFYSSFCRPIPHEEEIGAISRFAQRIQNCRKEESPEYMAYWIKCHIQKKIELFIKSFDGRFGFKYDMKSKETSLMYDPKLLRRVKQMNELFANDGWPALNNLGILMPHNHCETIQNFLTVRADGKVVNRVNIDEKVLQAHNFLTCKYALTLKKCCDYAILIWNHYDMYLSDSPVNHEQFVNTIIMIEPLVRYMQAALFHFYQISPHNKYNKTISDLLHKFKKYFKSKIYVKKNKLPKIDGQTSSSKALKENLDVESDMIGMLQSLVTFYEPNCHPVGLIHEKSIVERGIQITSSRLKFNFKQEIDKLIVSNYKDFGFGT